MIDIKDKVCVITGAGKIGQILALGLYNAGAVVIIGENNTEVIVDFSEKYKAELKTRRLIITKLDISNENSVIDFIAGIKFGKYGVDRVDAWINTAFPKRYDWGKDNFCSYDSFSWNMNSHLWGYYTTSAKIAYLMMIEQKNGGSVINFSSIYGKRAPKFYIYEGTEMKMPILYAMMKGAINMMSKYLAAYFGKKNIRFNVISPGGIFEHQDLSFVEKYDNNVPLGRMATEEDLIGLVIFLISDSSKYITGQNIYIDGGWTIW